jgi:hypothetical protein
LPRPIQHTRITALPIPEPIAAGHLDTFSTEARRGRTDLVLEYHALVPEMPGEIFERDGKLFERIQGTYQPRRLRFLGVERLDQIGLYQKLQELPREHDARVIGDLYNWLALGDSLYFYMLFGRSAEDAEARFYGRGVRREETAGEANPFAHERDWSPSPPMPAGLVPQPRRIHERFGGDPVTVRIDGKSYSRLLFTGGVDIQPDHRPDVHAVLNLGEQPSAWQRDWQYPSGDRWTTKGEGSKGMSVEEIRQEAEWVIERLHSGRRVLVHCAAGMNRSATICCAVMILLEGLSAEESLARVREKHPWARPDSHHWLALKWLSLHRPRRG